MHGPVQSGLMGEAQSTERVPLISIVIPAFDAVPYLEACLTGVLREVDTARAFGKADCEIIVVDDCSSDATGEMARRLLRDRNDARVVAHESNRGPAAARNTGIAASRGDYILFLDSDNTLLERALPRIAEAVCERADIDVMILGMDLIDAQGERTGVFYRDRVPANPLERLQSEPFLLLDGNIMDTFCIIRASAARAARYDESLSQLSDWDFWVRLRYEHRCSFAMLEESVGGYRLHPGQMSEAQTPRTRPFARQALQIHAKALAMAARLDLPLPAVQRLLVSLQSAGSAYVQVSAAAEPAVPSTQSQPLQSTPAPSPPSVATTRINFGARAVSFAFRSDNTGDKGMVARVFQSNDYNVSHWEQGRRFLNYYAAHAGTKPGLIIDAGANIGAAAVYFLETFKNSFICAIEPDSENFRLLELNTRAYQNKTNLHAAVADTDGELSFETRRPSDRDSEARAKLSVEPAHVRVPAVSVPSILRVAAGATPMILKCDIEGGEERVFAGNTAWMRLFPVIIVQLHDRVLPFSGTSRNFIRAVAEHDFDVIHRGDDVFLFNRQLLS